MPLERWLILQVGVFFYLWINFFLIFFAFFKLPYFEKAFFTVKSRKREGDPYSFTRESHFPICNVMSLILALWWDNRGYSLSLFPLSTMLVWCISLAACFIKKLSFSLWRGFYLLYCSPLRWLLIWMSNLFTHNIKKMSSFLLEIG